MPFNDTSLIDSFMTAASWTGGVLEQGWDWVSSTETKDWMSENPILTTMIGTIVGLMGARMGENAWKGMTGLATGEGLKKLLIAGTIGLAVYGSTVAFASSPSAETTMGHEPLNQKLLNDLTRGTGMSVPELMDEAELLDGKAGVSANDLRQFKMDNPQAYERLNHVHLSRIFAPQSTGQSAGNNETTAAPVTDPNTTQWTTVEKSSSGTWYRRATAALEEDGKNPNMGFEDLRRIENSEGEIHYKKPDAGKTAEDHRAEDENMWGRKMTILPPITPEELVALERKETMIQTIIDMDEQQQPTEAAAAEEPSTPVLQSTPVNMAP